MTINDVEIENAIKVIKLRLKVNQLSSALIHFSQKFIQRLQNREIDRDEADIYELMLGTLKDEMVKSKNSLDQLIEAQNSVGGSN